MLGQALLRLQQDTTRSYLTDTIACMADTVPYKPYCTVQSLWQCIQTLLKHSLLVECMPLQPTSCHVLVYMASCIHRQTATQTK